MLSVHKLVLKGHIEPPLSAQGEYGPSKARHLWQLLLRVDLSNRIYEIMRNCTTNYTDLKISREIFDCL